jgi:DNA polymerase elongation subunit (family B)
MDSFTVLDGIIWIDQMLLYANIRKTNGVKESYSLDAIANEELGKEKLDYTGYTIKNLPWLNFPRFFKYNIKDVVLLFLMEEKNLDIDMLQKLSDVTNTRKYKVFKKTISIKNFVNKFAEQQGYVMGNNKNAQYGNDSAYFEEQYLNKKQVVEKSPEYSAAFAKKENYGAYVGDPNLTDKCGIKTISGKNSMFLFENVFDEDFSALYPSIIRAYNLDKNTQVGKFFLIDDHIKNKLISEFGYDGLFESSKNDEGEGELTSNDIGPTLVDSLTSQNWSRIGEKFFDLPSTSHMIEELKSMKK